ncbi:hypothetical protein [Alphaproteobacteria bacterium endosymbiont of Tiliacea citrago]|uniref:hypothetical protein n=1 Tax=Alphaproteobacteria bacterium endosymbiont of Tiliacea citrago TaxID=3077944 RepID=UPI00313B0A84
MYVLKVLTLLNFVLKSPEFEITETTVGSTLLSILRLEPQATKCFFKTIRPHYFELNEVLKFKTQEQKKGFWLFPTLNKNQNDIKYFSGYVVYSNGFTSNDKYFYIECKTMFFY